MSGEAWIHPNAQLGVGVRVGRGTVIHENVQIGDHSTIDEHCVLGLDAEKHEDPLVIGAHAWVRTHTVLYAGSRFGEHLFCGHHSVMRAGIAAGRYLQVGNFCDIQTNVSIGDYTRTHGYVHIGTGSKIGSFVWLFSLVTLTNDPIPPSHVHAPVEIHDGAVLCVGVTPLPGTVVGKGTFVASGATVSGEIPPGALVNAAGEVAGPVTSLMNLEAGVRHPWMSHYADAYPAEAQEAIAALASEVRAEARERRRK